MDLKRLEYFCAIVEKGQISKAAEALHISQPPLSMRLKELEEELDVQLIYREGKAWQVTPEGEALYQRAQFILSYVAGLEKDIRESRNKVSGLVRIGVCPPCLSLASTPIPALNREFPDLRFRVWVMDNQSLERHMQERILTSRWSSFPCRTPTTPCSRWRGRNSLPCMGRGFPRPRHAPSALRN